MSPFVKLQPGYVTFGEHNIKFPHASLVATAVSWRYQCSVVPYYERRWCMFSIMVFFRCFYNSQWYRCQPCRAVSDIFTALSLVSFRWEDDWWCFSKNYWSLTSLQLSAPPSTTRWTTIISSPGSWIVCTQLTMASALWRCPVFHCLLLLLVCFHCSQGELPWNCCKQKCTFFSPGNFAQPFKNPLVIRGMNEANLLAHIVAAAPKRWRAVMQQGCWASLWRFYPWSLKKSVSNAVLNFLNISYDPRWLSKNTVFTSGATLHQAEILSLYSSSEDPWPVRRHFIRFILRNKKTLL